jgi:hypothetical protein
VTGFLALPTSKGCLTRKDYPGFRRRRIAYLKDDAAKEPIAASYSAPGVLADAAHKTGRAKADFELREISKEEYELLVYDLSK